MRTKAPTRSNHMDDQPLKGQKALVTGASSGIGEGVARALGAAGAAVVVNYVSKPDAAAKIVEEMRGNGVDAVAIRGDVSKEPEVEAMFAEMERTWGGIDILVNNAGLQRDAPVTEMTLEQWNTVLGVNLTGVFMKSLAQELAPHRIRVNSVAPGAIMTPINREAWDTPGALEKLLKLIPYGRIGLPEDIGKVVAFLASDDADYIHGQTIYVDGGMTLYPEFAHGG